MTFILQEQREKDVEESFRLYREYLRANESSFPRSAYRLATSNWYWDPTFRGCPHDGWLKTLTINEPATGSRQENRTVEIRIELLGPYHDGVIEFFYPRVFGYQLEAVSLDGGHRDWVYDELRMDERGNLVHEIEWSGVEPTARSLIVASDVFYTWSPNEEGVLHTDYADL